ncbi:solute carrier family 52, riboflavin transporter, member 3 isoform X2 [Diaphorina citri]|uniref:Riboflavin transporter n=1 Tax=Diaphorina citri TaxID=121845 RepID=A0A3Q0IIM7_DIACI|nr:solute carrier family 52, riboflavin transporter, member 3 isoform X1 [Diaphorina citri]XP_026676007.1 solute carrier family 52, riboflavin transporter, member 3 isoform X2 [Diaphorina citri]
MDPTTPVQKDRRVYKADICALFFGIGTWVLINGMFTQLPLLVLSQPEGWTLPSYLVILIQLANIGPVIYSVMRIGFPQYLHDTCLIYVSMVLGCMAMLYMSLYYDVTTSLFSSVHSTHLFLSTFLIALVCCTSPVLFTPFMGKFPEVYLISFLLGEGLSGFLPSIIALVQGIGVTTCTNQTLANGTSILVPQPPQPLFSTRIFFDFMLFLMFLSLLSFIGLNNLPSVEQLKYLKKKNDKIPSPASSPENSTLQTPSSKTMEKLSTAQYALLLILQASVTFFSHGVLPSLQSYSCLPYGSQAYHYTANLTNIASTLACFLAYFWLARRVQIISLLSGVAGVLVVYSLLTALMSPTPPLSRSTLGSFIIVINWVLCAGLISYIKLALAAIFRAQEGKGLFWYGAVNQLGSASGAIVIFLLINYTNLFNSVQGGEC